MEAATRLNQVPHEHPRSIVVVGSGPVGMRAAEEIARLDSDVPVTVLGDEPWRPYDRVRLSSLLARELRHDALYADRNLAGVANVEVISHVRIARIDRQARCVLDEQGRSYPYRKLVLATGSRPRVPPIPGVELAGVFVFRSLSDAQGLLARQLSSRSTVVIGGGLLGLEAARAMLRFNTRVHVVEHQPRLMFRQLDEPAAQLLRTHVERLGIRVHTGESVRQIVGQYTPSTVRLRSGREIACDTVVITAGIQPNVELARDAGLPVGRGIRVDDELRTGDPDIFAIGECCEHRDQIYGLVGPGIEQAAVAAYNVVGRHASYVGSLLASSLKVVGCPVFSMGEVDNSALPLRPHTFRRGDRYRRVNVYRGRIVGAVGVGQWNVTRLRSSTLERTRIWPWQLWLFRLRGKLWLEGGGAGVAAWPATAIVCNCRAVSRGRLAEALAAGVHTVRALSEATGAGTVCGSCTPLLGELVGAPSAGPSRPSRPLVLGGLAAMALVAAALVSTVPFAVSGANAGLDVLWTNAALKQTTGYALLATSLLLAALALRKRVRQVAFGDFAHWRVVHVCLGVAGLLGLAAHTGFRFGANLNLWLMLCFLGLAFVGGTASAAAAYAARGRRGASGRLQAAALWLHIALVWPLPVLIGFHILKGYYF